MTNTRETSTCILIGRGTKLQRQIFQKSNEIKEEKLQTNILTMKKLQEIMMLLIGESAMSFAHLVNGAVVNVRGRVGFF